MVERGFISASFRFWSLVEYFEHDLFQAVELWVDGVHFNRATQR